MLKTIIHVTIVDISTSNSHVLQQLSRLDAYMKVVDSEITNFILHVQSLVMQLKKYCLQMHKLLDDYIDGKRMIMVTILITIRIAS